MKNVIFWNFCIFFYNLYKFKIIFSWESFKGQVRPFYPNTDLHHTHLIKKIS